MADIFGTAGGSSQALADMQRVAQTQGLQLQNQSAALQLQEQQRMAQLAQQQAAQPGEGAKSPIEQLQDMASLAFKAGYVSTGTQLAGNAAKLQLTQAQTAHAQAQTFQQQADAAKKELEMVDQLLGGVNDQASWDAANSLFESMTGRKSPFSGMEYNPALVSQLQQSTLQLKDKLELAIKQQEADTRSAAEKSSADFRDFRKGILQQDADTRSRREARLEKAGGTKADVGAPMKSELDHAADVIQDAYPDLPQDEVNNASYAIASRARAIRKTTPGLDADTALDRAMAEAKAAGNFQTVNDTYKLTDPSTWFGGGKRTDFKRGTPGNGAGPNSGKTAASPNTTIPSKPQDREVGAYYKAPNGHVYQWQKDGWVAAGGE